MITNFPKRPLVNPAGLLQSFRFVPAHYVNILPNIYAGVVTGPVTFQAGLNWLNGLAAPEKLVFDEESASDANGTTYNWKISGFYPGDDAAAALLFEVMSRPFVTFLVVISDNRGEKRLVGLGAPLVFNAAYSSGTVPGEAKGYTFTFASTGLHRAPRYPM